MVSSLNFYDANKNTLTDKKIVKVEVSKEHLKTLNEASTFLITHVTQ